MERKSSLSVMQGRNNQRSSSLLVLTHTQKKFSAATFLSPPSLVSVSVCVSFCSFSVFNVIIRSSRWSGKPPPLPPPRNPPRRRQRRQPQNFFFLPCCVWSSLLLLLLSSPPQSMLCKSTRRSVKWRRRRRTRRQRGEVVAAALFECL